MFKKILVPVDFGPSSRRALDVALELAKRFDAELELVAAFEVPLSVYVGVEYAWTDIIGPMEDETKKALDDLHAETKKRFPAVTKCFRRGVPWEQILAEIEVGGADLVVMGTHGRRGVARALLGSVAEKIVRSSKVPVLTVHAPNTEEKKETSHAAR